mgnify:FL=1
MTKLFKYLKGGWLLFCLAPVFMIVEVMMDLMQPTFMSDIIDIGVANGDLAYVWSTGLKMIAVAFIGFIGGAGCSILSSFAAMKFGTNVRSAMFKKIQGFSFKELDDLKTSSLITRITNDVNQVQMTILMMQRVMIRAPLLCIGGIVMAVALSPKLSIIFIVVVPVLILFVTLIVRKAFPLMMKMQEKIDRVNTVQRENILGVKVVKAFVGHDKEKERFQIANEDLMNISMKAMRLTVLLFPIVTLIMNLSVVAVLWFGGNLAFIGEIETGKIMAFLNYLVQILSSLMMAVMLLMIFSRAQASAKRINEVLETESSIKDIEHPEQLEKFDVEFKNVCFRYNEQDEEYILKDINFTAKPGETIGIIGGTGSGKSTLIQLIPRLYDTTSGEVLIGGKNVKNVSAKELRQKVGVVMQESILFSGTIRENLKWGNENASQEELIKASKDAAAYEFIEKYPDGFDKEVEQRGKNFSGGQKQRLSIARTYVRDPEILIFDDSTSAVDMSTEADILSDLKKHQNGKVVFIIAQRISAIADADKIIVLDEGKISGMGKHSELIQNNEIYRSIVASQLGEEAVKGA